LVRIIWRIIKPTKIIIGTRDIRLSKTPLFYCSINDNTANATNSNLQTIINNKLAALNLSGYNAQMIMNRAEAMSCGE
jgi:hypothetical protein